jgi:hypothetical protein
MKKQNQIGINVFAPYDGHYHSPSEATATTSPPLTWLISIKEGK